MPTIPCLVSYAHFNLFYVTAPLTWGSFMLMLDAMGKTYQPASFSVKAWFRVCYFLCPVVFSYLYEGWKQKRAAHYATCNKKAACLF